MFAWFVRTVLNRGALSPEWIRENAKREMEAGVDLPRWRTPKERAEMARRERFARMAEARFEERRKRA